MFENLRRGRQAINFTKNVPKILVLKSSSEQIFSRKLPLGAPDIRSENGFVKKQRNFQLKINQDKSIDNDMMVKEYLEL